jgi:hypothetical protein
MKLDEYQIPDSFVKCSGCYRLLVEDAFPWRYTAAGVRIRMKICRSCSGRRRAGAAGRVRAAALIDEARSKPCVDCNQTLPTACIGLSAPDDAEFCPTKEAGRVSEKRLQAMIARCVPVCANCRAIRQAQKRQAHRVPRLTTQTTPMLAALAPEILQAHRALADIEAAPPDIGAAALALSQRLSAFPAGEGSAPQPP